MMQSMRNITEAENHSSSMKEEPKLWYLPYKVRHRHLRDEVSCCQADALENVW